MVRVTLRTLRPALMLALALGAMPGIVHCQPAAESPAQTACAGQPHLSLHALRRLGLCELERLYAEAEAGPIPTGCTRGRVLLLADTRMPALKARAFNLAWKGKCFEPDGWFINRWPGFKALPSHAAYGPSWSDGRPSLVMEYPAGTPLFANLHDEIRAVAPGVYLGRLYERCPCPRFVGFFALEDSCGTD